MPNSPSRTILLTGGSGTLGKELRKISENYNCVFIAPLSTKCDITHYRDVYITIKNSDCNTVVHAAAATDVPGLENDIIKACNINVIGTINILKACIELDKSLVYISTDYVFDGTKGSYNITDPINPLSVYAKSKAAAELMVGAYKNSTIIRTSFFGHEFPHPAAFIDQWSSKDYIDIIAPKIMDCIKSKQKGIFHVGSPRRTIYEIACERSKDVKQISRTTTKHKVPEDTSLIISEF
jgi:dTDP-4-dehydrorhamnose reductase